MSQTIFKGRSIGLSTLSQTQEFFAGAMTGKPSLDQLIRNTSQVGHTGAHLAWAKALAEVKKAPEQLSQHLTMRTGLRLLLIRWPNYKGLEVLINRDAMLKALRPNDAHLTILSQVVRFHARYLTCA